MPKRSRRSARPRPGRPPLPPEKRRARRFPIHLSPAELSLLKRRADRLGIPAYILARSLAVYGRVAVPAIPKVNFAALGQLGRTANLVQQALRHVRSGRLSADLRPLLEDSLNLIAALRHALVTPRS